MLLKFRAVSAGVTANFPCNGKGWVKVGVHSVNPRYGLRHAAREFRLSPLLSVVLRGKVVPSPSLLRVTMCPTIRHSKNVTARRLFDECQH